MDPLNLPPFEYTLKREGDKVFILDVLRKKYLLLTPEEWVRQHFVHYLINDQGYPKALIKVEGGLKFNTLSKRSDIVVFTRAGSPWMLVECKSPDQKLRQTTIEQAATYNHTLRAPFVVITNGKSHICCEVDWTTGITKQLRSLPTFDQRQGEQALEKTAPRSKYSLKNAVTCVLKDAFMFKIRHGK